MAIHVQRSGILALALTLFLAGCGQTTLQPSTGRTAGAAAVPPVDVVTAASTGGPTADLFAGIAQGQTPEGYHTLGADSAPVKLITYSDFL